MIMKTNKLLLKIVSAMIIVALLVTSSCSKMMDETFFDGVTEEQMAAEIARNPERASVLVAGAISSFGSHAGGLTAVRHDRNSIMTLKLASDLMTEDMVQRANDWHYFDYDIVGGNNQAGYVRVVHTWNMLYGIAGQVNATIIQVEGMIADGLLTREGAAAVFGQCYAIRGHVYHLLIQHFQQTYLGNENALGVPVIVTPFDNRESKRSRGTVREVYEFIESDLLKAVDLLSAARASKDFINKAVAQGFLARVYMTMGEWAKAEQLAAEARANFPIMNNAGTYGYNDQNNSEWMWGLQGTNENTLMFASFQSHIVSDGDGYAGGGVFKAMDNRLFQQMGANDVRRSLHHMDVAGNVFFNTKFKNVADWLMDNVYMRSSEMLLIEAEAQARQFRNADAAATLMELMSQRDPDYTTTFATVEDIFLQKRLEMWGEGVIFYDYRRMRQPVDRNYATPFNNHLIKAERSGISWRVIYQIPQQEINNNDQIRPGIVPVGDQNPFQGES
jgi:hypothetical protein